MTAQQVTPGRAEPRPTMFDPRALAALIRASHPQRRLATAVARLSVGPLDRQPDTATAWVFGAYATVLGRLPDAGGLRTYEVWLRSSGTPQQLIALLASSDEARDTGPDRHTDLDDVFVTGAYLAALGRRPDRVGGEVQREALRSGATPADVLRSMLGSDEARLKLRFPPSSGTAGEHLARAVQQVVSGDVDRAVHEVLLRAARDGRSVTWMVRTAYRLRAGRRAEARALPRVPWLGHLARRRAAADSLHTALEVTRDWDWQVQRKLLADVERLSHEVAGLREQLRAKKS